MPNCEKHPQINRDIRTLWEVFEHGGHLTIPELKRLAKSAENGLEYLQARGEHLAAFKTNLDLHSIRDYIAARARSA